MKTDENCDELVKNDVPRVRSGFEMMMEEFRDVEYGDKLLR
jgi:hypothetical protein